MTPVEVDLGRRDGIAVAAVAGEVDLDARECFEAGLAPVRDFEGPVVLDLGDVPFMDSSGLHVVLSLLRSLQKRNRTMVLAGPRPSVRKLLELTAVDRRLAIYDDADAAVEALRAG